MVSETYEKKEDVVSETYEKNEDVLKNLKTEKTLLNTIKARKLNFFRPHQTPGLNYEKHPRKQDGWQKIMRQALGSVVRLHQGVVQAQLNRVWLNRRRCGISIQVWTQNGIKID